MKRVIVIGGILVGAIFVAAVAEAVRRKYFEKPGSMSHLKRIAADFNNLDEPSEAFDITATAHSDRSLSLRYTMFDAVASEVDDATKRELREKFRAHWCTHKSLRELLDNGVVLRITIADRDDVPILQSDLLRWECGSVTAPPSQ